MSAYSTRSMSGNWLTDSITRNPEGLLLLAAGCALLMRKATSSRSADRAQVGESPWSDRNRQRGGDATGHYSGDRNGGDRNFGNTVADAARSVGEYASDVSDKVAETASGYASSCLLYTSPSPRDRS